MPRTIHSKFEQPGDADLVHEIAVEVYKMRLEDSNPGDVARLLAKPNGAASLANQARSYEPIVKATIIALRRRG